jgi:Domain of unknown function (DUF2431)
MNHHDRSKRQRREGSADPKHERQQQQRFLSYKDDDDGSSTNKNSAMMNVEHQEQEPDDDNDTQDEIVPTRDCSQLYCSAATLHCARKKQCIPCAYKIACFDVALDTFFCRAIPNQRPEACPRDLLPKQTNRHASRIGSALPRSSCMNRIPVAADEGRQIINVAVAEMGTLGYQPHYRILTIGDGDFSFSLALAFMLLYQPQQPQKQQQQQKSNNNHSASGGLTATSFESKETLEKTYGPEMMHRIQLLESMGVRLLYQVDGTKLTPEIFSTPPPPQQQHQSSLNSPPPSPSTTSSFHRIVWNFPCSAIQKGQDGQNQEMEFNKTLIRDFVAGAIPLLDADNGQIHINHKTKVRAYTSLLTK